MIRFTWFLGGLCLVCLWLRGLEVAGSRREPMARARCRPLVLLGGLNGFEFRSGGAHSNVSLDLGVGGVNFAWLFLLFYLNVILNQIHYYIKYDWKRTT